jgi:hypothetical protein
MSIITWALAPVSENPMAIGRFTKRPTSDRFNCRPFEKQVHDPTAS